MSTPRTDAWSQRLQRAWSDYAKGSLFTDTVLPALNAIESEVRTLESENAVLREELEKLLKRRACLIFADCEEHIEDYFKNARAILAATEP